MSAPSAAPTATSLVRRILPDVGAVALLWSLCMAFLWPLVMPNASARLYFGRGDLTDQFFAFRRFIADQLWAGHLPLWNPYMFAGHPAVADIQSATFYPLTLLTTLLAGRDGLPFYALQLEILADFWLGALFMYLFARQVTRRRGSAILVSVAFALGGYLTSYPPEQLPVLEGSIWLPLALCFAHRAGISSGGAVWRNVVWTGVALGMSVLAGHPQVAMLTFYTTLIYLVYVSWRYADGQRAFLAPLAAGLVGLGVGAVQWLPTLELLGLSTRSGMTFEDAQAGFPLGDLLSPLFPGYAGRTSPLYVGILPLTLALIAVVSRGGGDVGCGPLPRRCILAPGAFWMWTALVSLLLSLGGNTFLYSVPYLVLPGFGLFRGQERLALVYAVAVVVLAGFGADELADQMSARATAVLRIWRRPLAGVVAVFVALVVLFVYQSAQGDMGARYTFGFLRDRTAQVFVSLVGTLALLALCRLRRLTPPAILGLAVLLTSADLSALDQFVNVARQDPIAYYEQYPQVVSYLRGQPQPYRVHNDKVFPDNFGALYQVAAVQGNSPLSVRALQDLSDGLDPWRFWLLLDVRAVVSRQNPGPGSALVLQEGDVGVYWMGQPRHAWVVGQTRLAASEAEEMALLAAADLDVQSVAVVRDAALVQLDGRPGQAQVTVYRPQYMAIQAEAPGRSLLVVSEVFYPGWRARVDGEDAPLYRVDHALRGVLLDAGVHRVEMVFQPLSFWLGAALSLATLVIILALTVRRRR